MIFALSGCLIDTILTLKHIAHIKVLIAGKLKVKGESSLVITDNQGNISLGIKTDILVNV